MDPQNQPTQPSKVSPMFNEPYVNPMSTAPDATPPTEPTDTPKPSPSRKLILGLAVAAGVELLLILGLCVALVTPKTANRNKNNASNSTSQSLAPQPATSISVQQTNDTITQDISNLTNSKDFPAAPLDDRTLGL